MSTDVQMLIYILTHIASGDIGQDASTPNSLCDSHTFAMYTLPAPLVPLICASLITGVTTFALALACLVVPDIHLNHVLWFIPVTFVLTLLYHITVLVLARRQTQDSGWLFSAPVTALGFLVAASWTACAVYVVSLTIIVGKQEGGFEKSGLNGAMPGLLITPCILCPIQAGIMWVIAVLNRKERRALSYAAKWRFLPTSSAQTSWRSV